MAARKGKNFWPLGYFCRSLWCKRYFIQNGKFEKVADGLNSLIEGKKIQKTFVNYFSFGIDGKVGYSFDMHRASSRLGNLIVYGALGIVKGVTKTKTVDELIESFWISPHPEHDTKHSEGGVCVFKSALKG